MELPDEASSAYYLVFKSAEKYMLLLLVLVLLVVVVLELLVLVVVLLLQVRTDACSCRYYPFLGSHLYLFSFGVLTTFFAVKAEIKGMSQLEAAQIEVLGTPDGSPMQQNFKSMRSSARKVLIRRLLHDPFCEFFK